VDRCESRVIRKPPLENGHLRHCRWRDSYGRIGSRIVPVIVNWLNWKVTYWISLMSWLVAFEFFNASIEMDFDWIGRWCVSRLVGHWNQLGIVCATVDLDWVDNSGLFCFCNSYISSSYDVSIVGITMRLWPIGLWNPHKIVSVTVNLNSIDISRHFADTISALKTVLYLVGNLRVVACRKGVIHAIQYAKRIRH